MKFHTLRYILIAFFFLIGLPSYGCVCPSWDNNGNLSRFQDFEGNRGRFHDWDEENRLRMVVGNKQAGYYGYDANNERVYKLTGESTLEYVDEHETRAGVQLDNAVLYPNPYIVITPKGYTKHYYANGERLATVLGQGGFGRMYSDIISHFNDTLEENLWGSSFKRYENEYPFEYLHETYPFTKPNVDIADCYIPELEYQCGEYHLSGLKLQWDKNILLYTIEAFQTVNDKETDIFYTHNNHLGSSSWITRFDGKPVQYMHYLPYGQLLANQTPTGYDERYKFIGKERDYESGYDFFGARYYIPPFIHFASTEPFLDKYLHISPYSYAAWNPLKYVDSDGKDIYTFDSDGNFTGNVIKQDGDHIGRIYLSKDNYMDFSFNDQADAQRICTQYSEKYFTFNGKIDDNAITHVSFVNNEKINSTLTLQTKQPSSLLSAIIFAWSQSRKGVLDFVNQPSSFLQTDANTLFLPTDGMNVVYNSFDFGNYLWGQSMQRLNIPLTLSLLGANIDNLFHHWPLQLDSKADQQAITNGYLFNMRK